MKKIWIRALVLIAATVVGVIAKADEPAITSQPVPTAPANAATERRAAWDKAWQPPPAGRTGIARRDQRFAAGC